MNYKTHRKKSQNPNPPTRPPPPQGSGAGSLLDDPGSAGWSHPAETLPPLWVDLVDQVDDDVRQINDMMAELKTLHSDRIKR